MHGFATSQQSAAYHATSTAAIRVENVSKHYRISATPARGLKGALLAKMAGCLDESQPGWSRVFRQCASTYCRDFQALKPISFEVAPGECVGVIGNNGSGKSTLLQIVAGTLQPSTGRVLVKGRVTSLLELGSGFNPEFSGRDNVFMNGAILGVSNKEMDRKFRDIAAFADIGTFIDQPVKTYSSGMAMRLAFAVQVMLEPDVLIVDEALAVGDLFFRQKCYDYMRELIKRGVALLFVTHDLGAVQQFCRRVVVLNHGECRFIGSADEGVKRYQIFAQQENRLAGGETDRRIGGCADDLRPAWDETPPIPDWPAPGRFMNLAENGQVSNGWARCTRVALCDTRGVPSSVFEQGETATFYFEFVALQDLEMPSGGIGLQDGTGQTIHAKHSIQHAVKSPALVKKGSYLRYRQDIRMDVACGQFTYHVGFFQLPAELLASGNITNESFLKSCTRILETERMGPFTVVLKRSFAGFQLTHWGIADLPGTSACQIIPPSGML
jgi:lipopolysaccharide transport system ATP-binding protein